MIRRFPLLTILAASAAGCDLTSPTLAVRVEVSPAQIVAGGSDTATIRVTIVNLTAVRVARVVHCDNLFAVETSLGEVAVSNYRVTCPVENSIPLRIELDAFESVEIPRLWAGVNVRHSGGGYETVTLPVGSYRVYGALGELRSPPRVLELVAP